MKHKTGFTIIELLAVIVILALLALITTPVVMSVINNARKNSAMDSAYGYVKAVDLVVPNNYNTDLGLPNGKYKIKGNSIVNTTDANDIIAINYKGTNYLVGELDLIKGTVITAKLNVDGFDVSYDKGKIVVLGESTPILN